MRLGRMCLGVWMVLAGGAGTAWGQALLEPDTQFEADRWEDRWWEESQEGLAELGPEARSRTAAATTRAKGWVLDGIPLVEDTRLPGVPAALEAFQVDAADANTLALDVVRKLPEHATAAGTHLTAAAQHARQGTQEALQRSQDAASVGVASAKESVDLAKAAKLELDTSHQEQTESAAHLLQDVAKGTGSNATKLSAEAWDEAAANRQSSQQAAATMHRALRTEGSVGFTSLVQAATRHPAVAATRSRQEVAAAREALGDNVEDAQEATLQLATQHAGERDLAVNQGMQETRENTRSVASRMVAEDRDANAQFQRARAAWKQDTLDQAPRASRDAFQHGTQDALALWDAGYHQHFQGGMKLAGDNLFAGDVEGLLVASWYGAAGWTQGMAMVLVLEPLAFSSWLGVGAVRGGTLGAGGVAGLAGLDAAHAVGGLLMRAGGAAVLVGVMALGVGQVAATWGVHALGMAAELGVGAAQVGGTALLGSLNMAAAAVMGALDVVGGSALLLGAAATWGLVAAPVAHGTVAAVTVLAMGAQALWAGMQTTGAWAEAAVFTSGAWVLATGVSAGSTVWHALGSMGIPLWAAAGVLGALTWAGVQGAVNVGVVVPAQWVMWSVVGASMALLEMVKPPFAALGSGILAVTLVGVRLAMVLGAAGVALPIMLGWTAARTAVVGVNLGIQAAISGTVKTLDGVTAPFRFERQLAWRQERTPQLEAMLARQPVDVQERLGVEVAYVRVVPSGPDRGKVQFFDVEQGGQRWRFQRHVSSTCAITYRAGQTELDAGLKDARCMALHGSTP